jgi:HD-GYP domain-containing protein (c-di-GMP phosphodiesterase class II)
MDAYPQEVWIQFLINLSRAIDSRVSHSGRHSAQVAYWVRSTARQLKFSEKEVNAMFWAAMLHDVGKISVPDEVLSKAGPLTSDEWKIMRLHPIVGANIVGTQRQFVDIAPYIYSHQEKYDGTGYPAGISGEEIPLGARILAVADAYEAMTDHRVYRMALSRHEATRELRYLGGRQFDPEVVETFLEVVAAS